MFEGMDLKNMGKMMEQMQEKATQMQKQSKQVQLTAKGGGGMIEVTANGMGEVIDMTIDDALLADKASLQLLLISTINEVLSMVEDNKKSQAMGMFGGLNPFGGNG